MNRDPLEHWYREMLVERYGHLHPEYKPASGPEPAREDYPPVTLHEAARHRREAVAEMFGLPRESSRFRLEVERSDGRDIDEERGVA